MNYEVVIGLEMHVELNTKTKAFCGCINEFGGAPNSHCCPVCVGLPGALPVVNDAAVNKTIMAGLATKCEIANEFHFDRKNYFYPDLAKAYQISQDARPICKNGYIEITNSAGQTKKIRINRIHLEEDSGKLTHNYDGTSYIDYNRAGVPLIETVSEPDIRSAEEAILYLNELKNIYKAIGVSECKMEQGMLRCDVNISLREFGSKVYGTRTEMKNLNSFKAIERAINYEVQRQTEILNNGGKISQATLRWDDELGKNFEMRKKSDASDYRYFKEPDIYDIKISEERIKKLKESMPLLPSEIVKNLIEKYGLNNYDANLIARDSVITNLFYDTVKFTNKPKQITNWITSEINKRLNLSFDEDTVINIKPSQLAGIIDNYDNNVISQPAARKLFDIVWEGSEDSIDSLIDKFNFRLSNDTTTLEKVVKEIIDNNPKAVQDYKSGNSKAMAFFVGQTMKAMKGQANAGIVNDLIKKLLSE